MKKIISMTLPCCTGGWWASRWQSQTWDRMVLDDPGVLAVELADLGERFRAKCGGPESSAEVGVEGGDVTDHAEYDFRRQGGGDPVVMLEGVTDLPV
jgi:hypothetical protein